MTSYRKLQNEIVMNFYNFTIPNRHGFCFDRNIIPDSFYKLHIAIVIYFICVGLLFIICTIVGCIFQDSVITFAVMLISGILIVVTFIVLYKIEKKLFKKIIPLRIVELEKAFYDMSFEDAREKLIQSGIINDNGFICSAHLTEIVIPFDKACFAFGKGIRDTKVVLEIAVVNIDDEKAFCKYDLNCVMYNFLLKGDFDLSGNEEFDTFKDNKELFVRLLFWNTLRVDIDKNLK